MGNWTIGTKKRVDVATKLSKASDRRSYEQILRFAYQAFFVLFLLLLIDHFS